MIEECKAKSCKNSKHDKINIKKAKECLVYLNIWNIKILEHNADMCGLSRSKAIKIVGKKCQ